MSTCVGVYSMSIFILSFHLLLGLPSRLLPVFLPKACISFSSLTYRIIISVYQLDVSREIYQSVLWLVLRRTPFSQLVVCMNFWMGCNVKCILYLERERERLLRHTKEISISFVPSTEVSLDKADCHINKSC